MPVRIKLTDQVAGVGGLGDCFVVEFRCGVEAKRAGLFRDPGGDAGAFLVRKSAVDVGRDVLADGVDGRCSTSDAGEVASGDDGFDAPCLVIHLSSDLAG